MTSFQDTPQANHLLVNSGVNRWSFNLRKWRNQTRSTRGQSRGVAQVGKKLVEWSLSIWSDIWRKNMLHGSVSPKGACTICLWNGCNFMVNVLYFVCFIYSGISLIRNSELKILQNRWKYLFSGKRTTIYRRYMHIFTGNGKYSTFVISLT